MAQSNFWSFFSFVGTALILILAFFGGSIFTQISAYDLTRILLVFLITFFVILLSLSFLIYKIESWRCLPILVPFVFFVIFNGGLGGGQYIEPIMYCLYFILALSLGYVVSSLSLHRFLIFGFLLAVLILSFIYGLVNFIFYWTALLSSDVSSEQVLPVNFENIRLYSHLATWMLPVFPVIAGINDVKNSLFLKFILVFAGASCVFLIFFTSSRGTALSIIIGFLIVSFVFQEQAKIWLKWQTLFFVFGFSFWVAVTYLIPNFYLMESSREILRFDTSGRVELWVEAFEMSVQNFPFGMGSMSWLTHEPISNGFGLNLRFGSPHNMYLFFAAEYGWLTTLSFVSIFIFSFSKIYVNRYFLEKKYDGAIFGFCVSVSGVLVHSSVAGVLIAPASLTVGLLVLIIFFSFVFSVDTENKSICKSNRSYSLFLLFLACVTVVWVFQVNQFYNLMIEDKEYYQKMVESSWMPRFWLHGYYPREELKMK